jgi:hypothetical protein
MPLRPNADGTLPMYIDAATGKRLATGTTTARVFAISFLSDAEQTSTRQREP